MTARCLPCFLIASGKRSATVLLPVAASVASRVSSTVAVSMSSLYLRARRFTAPGRTPWRESRSNQPRLARQPAARRGWRAPLRRGGALALGDALEVRDEEAAVDPPVEYRYPHLHALGDHLPPLHVELVCQLGRRQVIRHECSSSVAVGISI